MNTIEIPKVPVIYQFESYLATDPMTRCDAALLQMELQTIQILLMELIKVVVANGESHKDQ